MREDEILPLLISDIEAEVGNDVQVRTAGIDALDNDVDPPEVVIEWNASRLPNMPGHNSRGGVNTDQIGNNTGIEHHSYWAFEADCRIRYYDEVTRDKTANNVQMALLPYEYDATKFHRDTREWEIGSLQPRANTVVEPDWYESGILVTFEYIKRSDESVDVIDTINSTVDGENLDTTTSNTIN